MLCGCTFTVTASCCSYKQLNLFSNFPKELLNPKEIEEIVNTSIDEEKEIVTEITSESEEWSEVVASDKTSD